MAQGSEGRRGIPFVSEERASVLRLVLRGPAVKPGRNEYGGLLMKIHGAC